MELKFAPREVFEQILEYAVIPTFDLVLDIEGKGVILLRRIITPYKDVWALPGLRMFKPEGIDDTLSRIARAEVGLNIDPAKRLFLGQFVGKFSEEHARQDLSTGYAFSLSSAQEVAPNPAHFSALHFARTLDDVPPDTGEMYRFYLAEFFRLRAPHSAS